MGMLWRGSHKFRGPVDFLRGVSGVIPTMAPGDVAGLNKQYYVNPTTGSDTANDGKSWHSPFASFEKGIDMCRFDADGSTIADDKSQRAFLFLAPGHYNETTQLLYSGYNISVIGCGPAVPGKDYGVSLNYDGSSASTAVVLINGSGNELAGVHIYDDAAIPAIYLYFPGDNNYIHDCVIEMDGTTATTGIYATTMKGSWIENVTIQGFKTYGIAAYYDAADQYAINGGIKGCHLHSNYSNTTGIYVHANLSCYNFWIQDNYVGLTNGTSCKGIDVDNTTGGYVTGNKVAVPTSSTPIEHAGGEAFWWANWTTAGTVTKCPNPATE